jgi:hypothetical protein
MRTDVSIIVNGHREGLVAVPSIRSAALARACAVKVGIAVETIYVLDLSIRIPSSSFAPPPMKVRHSFRFGAAIPA